MVKLVFMALLFVLAILGAMLISDGITGMVSLHAEEQYIKPLCLGAEDCDYPEVCCYYYGAEGGVCQSPDMCREILAMTMDGRYEELPVLPRKSSASEYLTGFLLGLIIIAAVIYFSEKKLAEKIQA